MFHTTDHYPHGGFNGHYPYGYNGPGYGRKRGGQEPRKGTPEDWAKIGLSKEDAFLLAECLLAGNAQKLLLDLHVELQHFGYDVISSDKYLYGTPKTNTIPVLMVAHCDTVPNKAPHALVSNGVELWAEDKDCSGDGLGADDRAGVFVIRKLLRLGLRPQILFTDEEEHGCVGAKDAIRELAPEGFHAMIQIDRRGKDDCVFYRCPSAEIRAYAKAFGFTEAQGSSTDVAHLGPEWGVAAVNLSAGYYREHSKEEYMKPAETMKVVERVAAMLANPPGKLIPFATPDEKLRLESSTRHHQYSGEFYG